VKLKAIVIPLVKVAVYCMNFFARLFKKAAPKVADDPANALPNPSSPAKPSLTPASAAGESLGLGAVMAQRKVILQKFPMTKGCDIPPGKPATGVPETGLLRLVLYRLDEKPVVAPALKALVISLIQEGLMRMPAGLSLFQCILSAGDVPWPLSAFSLKVGDEKQGVGDLCKILVISEYAQPDGGSFFVEPTLFNADGAMHILFYVWRLEDSLGKWSGVEGDCWRAWLDFAARLSLQADSKLAELWRLWFKSRVTAALEEAGKARPDPKAAGLEDALGLGIAATDAELRALVEPPPSEDNEVTSARLGEALKSLQQLAYKAVDAKLQGLGLFALKAGIELRRKLLKRPKPPASLSFDLASDLDEAGMIIAALTPARRSESLNLIQEAANLLERLVVDDSCSDEQRQRALAEVKQHLAADWSDQSAPLRFQHYLFAHTILRQAFFADARSLTTSLERSSRPYLFSHWKMASDKAKASPDRATAQCSLSAVPPDGLAYSRRELSGGVILHLVQMPAPQATTEAYSVGLVAGPGGSAPTRYFVRVFDPTQPLVTEWKADGTREHFPLDGDSEESFLAFIEGAL
jgi:hypothetical protein